MPLYEYQCQECGESLEAIQKFSDPPYAICPQCGGALKKLVSAPAIQFKGSGFYINDYAKGNSGASSSKAGNTKKPETSTSSTPATGSNSDSKSSTD